MAKLIYAVTALALAALVSGFFVDTSNAPLFASIVLSGCVMLLILFGWSRRIRSGMDLMDAGVPQSEVVEELAVADLDEEEFKPAPRRKRPVVTGARTPADVTAVIDPRPKRPSGSARPTARKPKPKPKPKPATKATPKAAASKPKRKPPAKAETGPRVVVIPGRERFHKKGCRFGKNDAALEVRESTARKRGYEPCNVCKP